MNLCDCGEGKIYLGRGAGSVVHVYGTFNRYSGKLLVGSEYGIQIEKGGCASLYDGSIATDEDHLSSNNYYGVFTDDEGSTFTMNGGTICNRQTGVDIRDGAVFTMNGGSITESNERGINVDGGFVKLSGNIRVSGSGEQDILLWPDYDSMDCEVDESDPDNPKYIIKDLAYYKLSLTGALSEGGRPW